LILITNWTIFLARTIAANFINTHRENPIMATRCINKVILIGNLGKDPELRYTSSGVAVASFTLATNESWKDPEGNVQERTQWHNIVAWRKLAEICGEYLKKGSKIYLEGKLQYRNYDDKNGVKRYVTEIVIDEMLMLDTKGGTQSAGEPTAPRDEASSEPASDLPF
jgi:single-strand DNA-binding protein